LPVHSGQPGDTLGGVLDVPGAGIAVIGLIEPKSVLPVGLAGDAEVDARLLTPEQVGRDREEALCGQLVTGLANIGVHAEQLLQNDDGGSRRRLRPGNIGAEAAVAARYRDPILHRDLLIRLIWTPAGLVGIGGGPLSIWIATVRALAFRNSFDGGTDNVDPHVRAVSYCVKCAEVAACSMSPAVSFGCDM